MTFLINFINCDFSNTFIKYKINIEREDITNYGIIYTPFDVVEEQLAQIPDHYFENPSLRWLDTGAGIGNYSIILFKRLYTGLATIIIDSDERCRHIIEKMIFMIEVFPEHIKHLRKVFGENANIIDRCFLSLEKSDFQNIGFDGFDGFDFIIGNPPYNINGSIKTPTNSKLKKGDDGKTVYVDFVYKSLDLLKTGGFLNYIIPSLWLKPDKAGLYKRLTNLKIHYLTPFNTNDSQKLFKYQAQTPTCYFLIENSVEEGEKTIKIWDKYDKEYIDYRLLPEWPIPCYGITILNKLLPYVEKYGYLSPYKSTTLKKNVKTNTKPTKLYPHKNIYTCRLNGMQPEIQYNWSDHECQYNGKTKLVLAHKMYGFPFLDISGEFGISSRDNYVFLSEGLPNLEGGLDSLVDIQKYLSTKFALFVFGTTNYRMRYLERYAFEFMPDIRKIEGFSLKDLHCYKKIDNYIADFFKFTEGEREIIELFSRDYMFNNVKG